MDRDKLVGFLMMFGLCGFMLYSGLSSMSRDWLPAGIVLLLVGTVAVGYVVNYINVRRERQS